jgi:hypothetical protein
MLGDLTVGGRSLGQETGDNNATEEIKVAGTDCDFHLTSVAILIKR